MFHPGIYRTEIAQALLAYPGAFLRRDRGNALYITNVRAKYGASLHLPDDYRMEESGALDRIFLTKRVIMRTLGVPAPASRLYLSPRLTDSEMDEEAIALFTMGIKAFEQIPQSKSDERSAFSTDYENALRKRTAVALRTGCGGGIRECAALLNWL